MNLRSSLSLSLTASTVILLFVGQLSARDKWTRYYNGGRKLSPPRIIKDVTASVVPRSSHLDYPILGGALLETSHLYLQENLNDERVVRDYFEQLVALKISDYISISSILERMTEIDIYRRHSTKDYQEFLPDLDIKEFPKLKARIVELGRFQKDLRSDPNFKKNFLAAHYELQKRIVQNTRLIMKLESEIKELSISTQYTNYTVSFYPPSHRPQIEETENRIVELKRAIKEIKDAFPILETNPLKKFISKENKFFKKYDRFSKQLYIVTKDTIENIFANLLGELREIADGSENPIRFVRNHERRERFVLNEKISKYILNEFNLTTAYGQITTSYYMNAARRVLVDLAIGVGLTLTTAGTGTAITLFTRTGMAAAAGLTSRGATLAYRGALIVLDGAVSIYYGKNILEEMKNINRKAFTSISGPSLLSIAEYQRRKSSIRLSAIMMCLGSGLGVAQATHFVRRIRHVSHKELFIEGTVSSKIARHFEKRGMRIHRMTKNTLVRTARGLSIGHRSSGANFRQAKRLVVKMGPRWKRQPTVFGRWRTRFFEANGLPGQVGYWAGRTGGSIHRWLILKIVGIPGTLKNFPSKLSKTLTLAASIGVAQGLISSYMGVWQVLLNQEMSLKAARQQRDFYQAQKKMIDDIKGDTESYKADMRVKELHDMDLSLETIRNDWFQLYLNIRALFPQTYRTGREIAYEHLTKNMILATGLAVNENSLMLTKLLLDEPLTDKEIEKFKKTQDKAIYANLNILLYWYASFKQYPEIRDKIETYMYRLGYYYYKDRYAQWLAGRLDEVENVIDDSITLLEKQIGLLNLEIEHGKNEQLSDTIKTFPQHSILFRIFISDSHRRVGEDIPLEDWLELEETAF